jgi:serine protease Do
LSNRNHRCARLFALAAGVSAVLLYQPALAAGACIDPGTGEPIAGSVCAANDRPAPPAADQLKPSAGTARGAIGVGIQQVTDDIADSMNIRPVRGAFVGGVMARGPAQAAGIERGDVILQFDNVDISVPGDLQRIVSDTPVGKSVAVLIVRRGREETKVVTVGRLEDGGNFAAANPSSNAAADRMATSKTLGIALANMSGDLRDRYRIKDRVNGVVVIGVDAGSQAADKRFSEGDVILEIAQDPVASVDDVEVRLDRLRTDGSKSAIILLSGVDGELRFVALHLQ